MSNHLAWLRSTRSAPAVFRLRLRMLVPIGHAETSPMQNTTAIASPPEPVERLPAHSWWCE